MPPPTVAVSTDDIKGAIGHFLGYGRGEALSETAWTTAQTNDINAATRSSYSLVCEPILPDGTTYNWSWLRPFSTVTIGPGTDVADLPEDFGGFEGPIFLTGTAASRWVPIQIANEAHLEYLHATSDSTVGPPRIACEQHLKEVTHLSSQRSNLRVWPVTDAAYDLRVNYRYIPSVLTGGYKYPPGGPLMGELFMAAAAAIAEKDFDDIMNGTRWQYFTMRLMAAIANDRRRKSQHIGYNGDPGINNVDGHGMRDWNRRYGWGSPLSVNGVVYD